MNLTPLVALVTLALFAAPAFGADAPAGSPMAAPSSSAAIPMPLTTGQVIPLWPEGVPGWKDIGPEKVSGTTYTNISNPRLLVFPPLAGTPSSGTAIVYCPGGGYIHVNTGNEIQRIFNPLGVTVFALLYRCQEFGAPAPLQDVLRAVRLVRTHAAEFGLNPAHIGVLGGSAGSHVAGCAGTLYDDPLGKTGSPLDQVSARPDFMILLFSVLSMEDPNASASSRKALLGSNPTPEMMDHYSIEKHVTPNTPPTFLIHTQGDTTVKLENELQLYAALRKNNVPVELHLYPVGTHGSGLDPNFGPTALWPKLCEEWMRFNGWTPTSPTSLMKVQTATEAAARGGRGGRRGASAPAADAIPAAAVPAAAGK
jgi:acetyl esterase/lipase